MKLFALRYIVANRSAQFVAAPAAVDTAGQAAFYLKALIITLKIDFELLFAGGDPENIAALIARNALAESQ